MWFRNLLISSSKIKKRIQIIGVTILVLILFGGGYYLATKGYLSRANLSGLSSIFEREEKKSAIEESPELIVEVPTPAQPEEKIESTQTSSSNVFEEIAQKGDGITHLARRVLKRYLQEKGESLGIKLSPGQKLFVEDYLQKKTGSYWLFLGEKISFSEELIKEAIDHAQALSQGQISNLDNLAKSVPSLNY